MNSSRSEVPITAKSDGPKPNMQLCSAVPALCALVALRACFSSFDTIDMGLARKLRLTFSHTLSS